jgi:L-asparaginase
MGHRPAIGVIGTGGTIACLAGDPLDTLNYAECSRKIEAPELVERLPEAARALFDIRPLPFSAVLSTRIGPAEWLGLARLITDTAAAHPDLAGFVVTHGTASLEETAYALGLVLKVAQPVVLVGAQRPSSAVGADGPANLIAGLRVAASPEARGHGVLVVLNDEIHAARDVTKTSTYRLQTFASFDTGPLGVVDADGVVFLRRALRRHTADSVFVPEDLARVPRVDIAYGYAGADGVAVQAFRAAGARGIVSAGMVPGMTAPEEHVALLEARAAGVTVVQAVRSVGGRVARRQALREAGFVAANGLNPQKARILLMLGLTRTADDDAIQSLFDTH